MNQDLLKAERELARGNTDEARVHAWNALATIKPEELPRLQEVGAELDDQLLIHEIDRRGVPAIEPEQPAKPFQKRSLILPLVFVIVILIVAVNTVPIEGGPPKPPRSGTALPTQGMPLLTENGGVWLVRLGRSERVPLQKLADELTFKYMIPVGVLAPIEQLPPWVLEEDRDALSGDQLFWVLRLAYRAKKQATIIGVTDYPMTSDALNLRRPFLLRNGSNYGVISTSELGAHLIDRLQGHTRYERTRKLAGRAIGFIHLKRPESPDQHSLLRSQMSGTGDIDALDERL